MRFPAVAALACLAGIALLVVIAYAIAPFPSADASALGGLEALHGPLATPVVNVIVHTGDPLPLALMLLVVVGAGLALDRRRQAFAAAGAVVGANVGTQVLKVLLAHPRVHPTLGVDHLWTTAFPSGHATASMSIALAAVIVCPPRLRSRVAPLAALYALAVATSLLVLGWHFPSDVLGGFLVAAGFAFGAVAFSRLLAGHEEPLGHPVRIGMPPPPLVLGAAGLAALVAIARHDDLVQFARTHSAGVAALLALVSACGVLVAGASRLADH